MDGRRQRSVAPARVRDRSVESDLVQAEKADPSSPGQAVALIEAMTMEASITTPVGGRVTRVLAAELRAVEADDLVLVVS